MNKVEANEIAELLIELAEVIDHWNMECSSVFTKLVLFPKVFMAIKSIADNNQKQVLKAMTDLSFELEDSGEVI